MPLRFNHRVRIAPGISLNFGKTGVSTTVGTKGAHVTIGHGHTRTTVGVPGTGISYTETTSHAGRHERGKKAPQRVGFLGVLGSVMFLLFIVWMLAS